MKRNNKILILSVGSGAQNALNYIYEHKPDEIKADFISIDSDKENLKNSDTKTMLIGRNLTKGMGSYGDPDTGVHAFYENEEMLIKKLKKYPVVFEISCLGGGTGSGASIALVKLLKDLRAKVYCLTTIPFEYEKKEHKLPISEIIDKLKYFSDVLSTIDNETQLMLAQYEIINKKLLERFLDIYQKEINIQRGKECI